ncbi:TPA: hypothetical protein ACPJ11_003646 [Vibrio diabolicus]
MLDFFFIGPLVIGFVCWFKAPNEEWESLAKDFSKRWALSLIAMIAAAALGGITMPNGPESSESAWLIFVGIIWFVCIVTMLWVALTTLMQAIKLKKQ